MREEITHYVEEIERMHSEFNKLKDEATPHQMRDLENEIANFQKLYDQLRSFFHNHWE